MGAAVAEGIIEELMKHPEIAGMLKKGEVVHFSACDGDKIKIAKGTECLKRTQINYIGDKTLARADQNAVYTGGYQIPGVQRFGVVIGDMNKMHPNVKDKDAYNFHNDTKTFKTAWDFVKALDMKLNADPGMSGKPVVLQQEDIEMIDSPVEQQGGGNGGGESSGTKG